MKKTLIKLFAVVVLLVGAFTVEKVYAYGDCESMAWYGCYYPSSGDCYPWYEDIGQEGVYLLHCDVMFGPSSGFCPWSQECSYW